MRRIAAKLTKLLGMLYGVLRPADTETRQIVEPSLGKKRCQTTEKIQGKAVPLIFLLRGQN